MLKVNIFDNTCSHHVKDYGFFTSTDKRKPSLIEFVHKKFDFDGITLFTDDYILNTDLVSKVKSKLKIAWCLESPIVQYNVHNNLHLVENNFDYIFCYRQDLIKKNPKKYIPNSPGGTYIFDNDIGLHQESKNKKCSMVLSGKRSYPGHILRHQIQNSSVGIDCFGWGSPSGKIENKIVALKDYMFHITIENVRAYHYFTEKLIDCLLTGCIPIYYGPPNIGDYFNIEGFVIFNSLEDLSKIKLSTKMFEEKKLYIKENFELAHKYISSDDFLATKLSKLI